MLFRTQLPQQTDPTDYDCRGQLNFALGAFWCVYFRAVEAAAH